MQATLAPFVILEVMPGAMAPVELNETSVCDQLVSKPQMQSVNHGMIHVQSPNALNSALDCSRRTRAKTSLSTISSAAITATFAAYVLTCAW